MAVRRSVSLLALVLGLPMLPFSGRLDAQQPQSPLCRTGCGGGGSYAVSVTPDGGAGGSHPAYTGNYTVVFTVTNTGTNSDIFSLNPSVSGNVTYVRQSLSSVSLGPDAVAHDTVTFSTTAVGTGTVSLLADGQGADERDNGSYGVTIVVAAGAPQIDTTAMSFSSQNDGRCAQSCFAMTYAQSTVPYFSLDAPRSVTVQYNGDRVNPHPIVLVNVKPDPSYGSTPTQFQLSMRVDGALVTFMNGEQTMHFAYADTAWHRIGGQFDASSYSTGVHSVEIDVAALYSGGTLITNDVAQRLMIVNDNASPIAKGWSLVGTQRVYPLSTGSIFLTSGYGRAGYFQVIPNSNNCSFWSPPGDFSILGCDSPNGWRRLYPDSSVVRFNSAGYITAVISRFNDTTSFTYDGSNRVTKVTDPIHVSLTLAYGTNGLSTVTDTGGRVTTYTVDANSRLNAIEDPDSLSTKFGYDANARLDSITDRRGFTRTFGYDQAWKQDSVKFPAIKLYNDSTVSPVARFAAWQKVGVPYVATSGTPATMPRTDGIQAADTEPGGAVSRFTVNQWGEPLVTTDPLGRTTTVTYDGNGLPLRTVSPSGAVDSAVYNSSGLPSFVQTADATSRRVMFYGPYGQMDSASGGPQPTMRAYLGVDGRVDSLLMASASMSRFTYDSHGRVVTNTDGTGHLLVKHWYAGVFGNKSQDSIPGQAVTAYAYDGIGRDTATTAPLTKAVRTKYDKLNHQIKVYTGTDTLAVTTVYDAGGNVLSVTDKAGQAYHFAYNALGWDTAKVDPTNHAVLLKYNRDGDLMRVVNRRGQAISYTYDPLHRTIAKNGTNTDSLRWGYSSSALVDSAISPVSVEVAYFNIRGGADSIMTLMAGQTYWQRFHYESHGLLDSVAMSGGGIAFRSRKYVYSPTAFTLDTIKLGKTGTTPGATSVARNLDFLATTLSHRGGDQVNLAYSTSNQLGSTSSSAPYADTVTQMLNYDNAGRLSLQIKGDGTWGEQYTYDGLGRLNSDSLVQVLGSPPPGCTGNPPPIIGDDGSNCLMSETWTTNGGAAFFYDSAGNRKDQSGVYGIGNRITSFGGCSYGTDLEGEDTSRVCGTQVVKFRWSAESELDTVTVNGVSYVYHYDANGRLVRKDSSGTTKSYFLWQGDNLLAEIAAGGTSTIAEYSYYPGVDLPHAIVVGGVEYDSWADALGSASALTDSSGTVQRGYAYDAWGRQLLADSTLLFNRADRARWKGALWIGSEAGIYYVRNRWYDPSTGRFLSEDPLGLAAGINPYAYAASNPVAGNDPTGLDCLSLVGTDPLQNCVDGPPLSVGGFAGGMPGGPAVDPLGLGDSPTGDNFFAWSVIENLRHNGYPNATFDGWIGSPDEWHHFEVAAPAFDKCPGGDGSTVRVETVGTSLQIGFPYAAVYTVDVTFYVHRQHVSPDGQEALYTGRAVIIIERNDIFEQSRTVDVTGTAQCNGGGATFDSGKAP